MKEKNKCSEVYLPALLVNIYTSNNNGCKIETLTAAMCIKAQNEYNLDKENKNTNLKTQSCGNSDMVYTMMMLLFCPSLGLRVSFNMIYSM